MQKKNLKKLICAMATMSIMVMPLAGCKEKETSVMKIDETSISISTSSEASASVTSTSEASSPEASDKKTTTERFSFSYNNVKITPNDLMTPLVSALGDDYKYNESPSCAYIGLDKCYFYDGFAIYTYPTESGEDHVLQIVLTDDSQSTPEGLTIGDSASKVTELYGSDYEKNNDSLAYTKGNTTLQVIIKNDVVNSIQYWYTED